MDSTISAIDHAIAVYMFENKLTVEKMAESLDMTANTLRNKRDGISDWRLSEVFKLCEFIGKTPDELFGLK